MYTKTFVGLTAGQVAELVEMFGPHCHDWDTAQGTARVDFADEAEAAAFDDLYQFNEE